jgi:NadR type nicotinamide-nucleotide adenylyltransferase
MTSIKPLKIAVTGPESTGKSSLSQALAKHYNTLFVPEYAREYIENLQREYNQDDILDIAKGQLRHEQDLAKRAEGYLFCDTELIVTRIWCLHKYKQCDPWIDDHIRSNTYDLILLCDIDLPWTFDKQREHPHLREFFFNWYKKEIEFFGFPYRIVRGQAQQRINNAIEIINRYFA